jgi:patatin-like phospholipase/acyl hydrolase
VLIYVRSPPRSLPNLLGPSAQVWDAAMRTSAAPTYFPVYRGYTDGGLVANNPSIVAVTKAMAHYSNVNPKNVAVLSLGMSSTW